MSKVMIYTTSYCRYCHAAKAFLNSKGVKYREIDITQDHKEKRKVMEEFGWKTVPIILINERFIGGYDDLRALERENKLDELLKSS